jgi:hypothetical protein
VGPIENHPCRAGLVIAHAETREAAVRAAETAAASVQIETLPAEPAA